MAEDTPKTPRARRRPAGGDKARSARSGARRPAAAGTVTAAAVAAAAEPGATADAPSADDTRGLTLDDTPPTAAELGGATADGDGLTMAAITAASLGTDAAFEGASEPIVVAERVTLVAAVPVLDGVGVDGDAGAATDADAADADARAVDDRERWLMIAERAFLRAADRGFVPGGELEDWLAAEREVDARLGR